METIRDFIKNGNNASRYPEAWARTEALIDWVATQPELVEKVKKAVTRYGASLGIIAAQKSFYDDWSNTIFINMKDNPVEKGRYLGQDGKVYYTLPEQSFAHELEHAIQDDPTPPSAALERAKKTVRDKLGLEQEELDRKRVLIKSQTVQRDWGNELLMEHLHYRTRYRLALMEELRRDEEYLSFVKKYEVPAIIAENKVAVALGQVPRSLDYFASGVAGKQEGMNHLDMEKLLKDFEKRPFALNPEPPMGGECPIKGELLEAINRQQKTLKEAGVLPSEDLSGCLLLAPDNVEGNREYREAVTSRR